jgi:TorA maturation chaperone TorD
MNEGLGTVVSESPGVVASEEPKGALLAEFGAIASCGQILGALFLTDPKASGFTPLREHLAQLPSLKEWPFGTAEELDEAHALIREGLAKPSGELAREYQRLFIGPHHFNAPAWGSVYLDKDQVLFGISLLELRQWMRENGITLNEDKREPEDHIGKMLVLMGWLATEKPELLRIYLAEHLMPWAPRYLELLHEDAAQPFYRGLAMLARCTLEGIVEELAVVTHARKLYF